VKELSYNFKPYDVKQLYLLPPTCATGFLQDTWCGLYRLDYSLKFVSCKSWKDQRLQAPMRKCVTRLRNVEVYVKKIMLGFLPPEVFHTIWNKASLNLTYKIRAW